MKLYTKTGDDGTTALFGGKRVSKHHPRVIAYGDVDELNAVLGLVIAECTDAELSERIRTIQADLFIAGAELATPGGGKTVVQPALFEQLESWIDESTEQVPALSSFILPGGTILAARLHTARAVSRRAERSVVALAESEPVSAHVITYLNRLSDLLFAWARLVNHRAGAGDIPWKSPES